MGRDNHDIYGHEQRRMSGLVAPLLDSRESTDSSPCFRWLKLIGVSLSLTLCSGFISGGSLFIKLFVDAGVSSSVCRVSSVSTAIELLAVDGVTSCNEQYTIVSAAFNGGMNLVLLGTLPIGIAFDRHGGHYMGYMGGLIATFGTLGSVVVVEGAKRGFDVWTSPMLPLIIIVTDIGSMMNSFAILSLMWEFVDYQAMVMAIMAGTYSVASIIPSVLQSFMRFANVDLSYGILAVAFVQSIGIGLCYALVPAQEEYYKQAKKALGMPLPKPKAIGCCQTISKACSVVKVHWMDHFILMICLGVSFTSIVMYASLAGEYAKVLFKSEAAATQLPSLYTTLVAFAGGFLLPAICLLLDKVKHATSGMLLCQTASMVTVAATISLPTWPAQAACCMASAIYQSSFQVFFTKYAALYASPASFASLTGVLTTGAILVLCFWQAIFYAAGGTADDTMTDALLFVSVLGAVLSCIYCVYAANVGFPEMPVLLPEDELEIAQPFGCKTVDEVVYVLHMDSKRELLTELSSTDPYALAKLLQRVDFERMESNLGVRHIDSAARFESVASVTKDTAHGDTISAKNVHDKVNTRNARVANEDIHVGDRVELTSAGGSEVLEPHVGRIGTVTALDNFNGNLRANIRWNDGTNLFALAKQLEVCKEIGSMKESQVAVEDKVKPPHFSWLSFSPLNLSCCCKQDGEVIECEDPSDEDAYRPNTVRALSSAPPRPSKAARGPSKARLLNEKLIQAVRGKDRETVLRLYREEDPNLIYFAYEDLFVMLPRKELDAFEKEWESLITDEEYETLTTEKPELKVAFMKMMAYRAKKHLFG